MRALFRVLALCACGMLSMLALGCSNKANSGSTTTNTPPGGQETAVPGQRKVERGGAAPDTTAYPAPTGVQAGNYAGGRK